MTLPVESSHVVDSPDREYLLAALSGKSDRELLEAIVVWQYDANQMIKGLMESVREIQADPMKLFSGMLGG